MCSALTWRKDGCQARVLPLIACFETHQIFYKLIALAGMYGTELFKYLPVTFLCCSMERCQQTRAAGCPHRTSGPEHLMTAVPPNSISLLGMQCIYVTKQRTGRRAAHAHSEQAIVQSSFRMMRCQTKRAVLALTSIASTFVNGNRRSPVNF